MRRVFIIASKKDDLAPYFSCVRCLVDKKADFNKKLNSKDILQSKRIIPSRIKVVPERIAHKSHIPGPPDPATCCGSGCANCVWIEYVTEVIDYCRDRPLHEILDEIDELISNVGLREFVKSEIQARAKYR
ncbi:Oxidoreductase-like domain-containing protein [Dirofilaria immitis]